MLALRIRIGIASVCMYMLDRRYGMCARLGRHGRAGISYRVRSREDEEGLSDRENIATSGGD